MKASLIVAVLALWPAMGAAQMPSASQLEPDPQTVIPEITVAQDWQVICAAAGCQAEPRATAAPQLSLSVVQDDAGPVMILRAPLGLLLGEGVSVTVDARPLGRLGFMTCEADGCIAPARLDGALGRALRGGTSMTLTLHRRDGSAIDGTYSLLGFTAATASLNARLSDVAATP